MGRLRLSQIRGGEGIMGMDFTIKDDKEAWEAGDCRHMGKGNGACDFCLEARVNRDYELEMRGPRDYDAIADRYEAMRERIDQLEISKVARMLGREIQRLGLTEERMGSRGIAPWKDIEAGYVIQTMLAEMMAWILDAGSERDAINEDENLRYALEGMFEGYMHEDWTEGRNGRND
jgi:hypothetical protein